MNANHFFKELKRRNVFRVATAYAIAGWLIIQVATSVFPAFNFPDWTSQFVIILVAIGLPISLIVAWAFELTPEGVKKSKEVDITESVTNRTSKKLNGLIIGALSVALLFVVVERLFFAKASILDDVSESTQFETASIAVLPFIDLSPGGDQEYFSDGLSEELLNVLAKVEEMKVAGRTSSFKFKGLNEDLKIIGQQLGVEHILEGSVRKSGDRIRITAQLIKVSDGYHMWSENYDREYSTESIFDIQDEISQQVLTELKIRLLPGEELRLEKNLTESIAALEYFLEATQLVIVPELEKVQLAIEKYKLAIQEDPNFAEAYARLAMAYQLENRIGSVPEEESKKLIRESIDKALLIDGNLGRAYQALGHFYLFDREVELALETFERAIQLLPNDPGVLDGYHLALERNDRYEEGKVVQKRAYELEPLHPAYATHYANHLADDDKEAALALLEDILERHPNYLKAYSLKAHIYMERSISRFDRAFETSYEAYVNNPDNIEALQAMIAISSDLDLTDLSDQYIDKIRRLYPDNESYKDASIHIEAQKENYARVINLLREDSLQNSEMSHKYLLSIIAFKQGDYEKSKEYTEAFADDLLTEDFTVETFGDARNATDYALILKTLDDERFDHYKNLVVDYCENRDLSDLSEDDLFIHQYNILQCHILKDEIDEAIALLDRLYFKDGDKIHTPTMLEESLAFKYLEQYPQYQALKVRIYDDLHSMGNNAISSLKERGIWRDEQNIGN